MTSNVMYFWYPVFMRAGRLLSILMLLQTRGRLSAPAMAAELEVSQRTILRDIDHLSASGVPIWSDRGREGGFQLREGWSTNLTGLTEHESQALFLAGLPSAAAELGLGSASTSARLKILASLPDALRDNAEQVNARLHFDPIDWYRAATPVESLQMMAHCVWHQITAVIQYESWKGIKDRTLKPLGLVLKAGVWYTVALADESKEPRVYRLSNIRSIVVTEVRFKRAKRFDLASFWKQSTERFEAEIYTGKARLQVTQRGMKSLLELSAVVAEAARRTSAASEIEGWQTVIVPIEPIQQAARQILSIGEDIKVLEPAELREHMKDLIDKLGTYYR